MMRLRWPSLSILTSTFFILLLGFGLRLLVWRWREFYPLGGDEQEYLSAALTMLRERRYEELRFMRPPLYPLFLAGTIYLFDSLVLNLRLAQTIISAATIPFVYLLTWEIVVQHQALHTNTFQIKSAGNFTTKSTKSVKVDETLKASKELRALHGHLQAEAPHRPPSTVHRPALLAALLCALSYTLAANASELLSETLFLFGLTIALWLLLRAGRLGGLWRAALAGLALGALCLVRSVALPLLLLGGLWLALAARGPQKVGDAFAPDLRRAKRLFMANAAPLLFVLAALLVIAPWTARNYLTYGGLILIDTTGAENLWLDNDPAGREAVKAQLYGLGDDRLARQQLAVAQGQAVILADPARFVTKAQAELLKLFALEYADDMRARPAIWLPPAEVWARLLLGDGLWMLILLLGSYGLARAALRAPLSPAFILGLWALYIIVTAMIFHVELRYRLPLYPVLLPYAAIVLAGSKQKAKASIARFAPYLVPLAFTLVTLLHRPYPALAWQLGQKHLALAAAERALDRGDAADAETAAKRAWAADPGSALAPLALARAALLRDDPPAAEALLGQAITAIPQHPQAHLLRGDLLRQRGEIAAARADLAFENGSLQDLQGWSWERFASPPPATLDLGDGLDLGFLRGFHAVAEGEQGFRWSTGRAELRLAAPAAGGTLLLRLAPGRPDGSSAELQVAVNGQPLATLNLAAGWHDYRLPLPATAVGELTIELRSPTFAPRSYDRASPDGRDLGVMVDWVGIMTDSA